MTTKNSEEVSHIQEVHSVKEVTALEITLRMDNGHEEIKQYWTKQGAFIGQHRFSSGQKNW
ncbi:hypothetical protein RyT2_11770 [Pseudolactococcus yaeyamensis]